MESFRFNLGSLNQIPLGEDRRFKIGIHEVLVTRNSDGNLPAVDGPRTFKIWEENGKMMLLFIFPTVTMANDQNS